MELAAHPDVPVSSRSNGRKQTMTQRILKAVLLSGTAILAAQGATAQDSGVLSPSADTDYSPYLQHDLPFFAKADPARNSMGTVELRFGLRLRVDGHRFPKPR
jgi:hypothetical protein